MTAQSVKQLVVMEHFLSNCFTLVKQTQSEMHRLQPNPDLCVCISGTWQTEGTSSALQSVRIRTAWIRQKRPNRKITATP